MNPWILVRVALQVGSQICTGVGALLAAEPKYRLLGGSLAVCGTALGSAIQILGEMSQPKGTP